MGTGCRLWKMRYRAKELAVRGHMTEYGQSALQNTCYEIQFRKEDPQAADTRKS